MSTTDMPRGDSGPRYVRFQAELVLEVADSEGLRSAALSRIAGDTYMPLQERHHAEAAVGSDESEALAYLIDPADLVTSLPGVELVQASWSCSHTEYDPAAGTWGLTEDDDFPDD
ncbi:hypothetical protein [Streptomyces sp. HPF1205]|uniref:hypothetical protein n=1 Tax=Streptomyces sp. HPF1205 TaxID=2873262 RepID=UPI001CED4445|nr:hypothetical protein [Streptomyces sp. HPF1205]